MPNLGKAIQEIRVLKNLSQGDLAAKIGITQTALSRIENGDAEPRKSTLNSICRILKTPKEFIMFKSLEVSDVSKNKKEIFKKLSPSLNELIDQCIKPN